MFRSTVVSLLAVVALCTLAQANPTYVGDLSSANVGQFGGAGDWLTVDSTPVIFSWTVTQNNDYSWHYRYVFDTTGSQGAMSNLLLETSTTFTSADIWNVAPSGLNYTSPGTISPNGGSPGLPSSLYGIKFDGFSGTAVATIDFDSSREPIWGDFYAKDGSKGGYLWNGGFLAADPTAAPTNGTLANHILVPDTTVSPIPAPGALILGSLGASLISWLRRRRAL